MRAAYPMATVALVPTMVVLGLIFGLPDSFGWGATAFFVVLVVVLLLFVLSLFWYLTVELGSDEVVLRGLLWRTRIRAQDVASVSLTPPVRSESMEWSWWAPDSQLVIRLRRGRLVNASLMPDGLKLRIANALDPASFPLPTG